MKRTTLLLTIILLSISIVACSSTKNTSGEDVPSNSTVESSADPTPTSTPTPSPTPTPTPAIIKSIKYEVVGSDRVKIGEAEYDSNGNVIKNTSYKTDYTWEESYTYDDDGVVVAKSNHMAYTDGSTDMLYEWTFAADNVQESYKFTYVSDSTNASVELLPVYDENNHIVGMSGSSAWDWGDGAKPETLTEEYTFNDQDQLIETYRKDGSTEYTTKYTYDDQGRKLSEVCDCSLYSGNYSYYYTYSESGRLMTQVYEYRTSTGLYSYESYTVTTKNEYDENGLLIKSTEETKCISNGSSYTDLTTYEYDRFDNLLRSVTETQKNGFKETITYEYENVYE